MTRREGWMVALLTMVTCGFYGYYWHYQSTEELKVVANRPELSGMKDVLLGFLTCSFYVFYAEYRNAKIVAEVMAARGIQHSDRSQTVLILNALILCTGVTGYIARMMLQDEYNKLADVVGAPAGAAAPVAA